jgi:hypothetical protein
MFGERAVARFAVYARMDAFRFGFRDIGMTRFAGLVTGVSDWTRTNFGERVTAIVAVDPEALGEEDPTKTEEEEDAEKEDARHPEEMGNIPKFEHRAPANGYM